MSVHGAADGGEIVGCFTAPGLSRYDWVSALIARELSEKRAYQGRHFPLSDSIGLFFRFHPDERLTRRPVVPEIVWCEARLGRSAFCRLLAAKHLTPVRRVFALDRHR